MANYLDKNGVQTLVNCVKDIVTETVTLHEAEYKQKEQEGTLEDDKIYFIDDAEGGGGTGGGSTAKDITYDNKSSKLSATNTQDAIDEVNQNLDEISKTQNNAYTSIIEMCNAVEANGIKNFTITQYENITDYPTALINIGAVHFPIIEIKRFGLISYITVKSVIQAGIPYILNGYATGSTLIWNTPVIEAAISNLTASDGLMFKFGKDGDGNYGYYGADGSLIPFSSGVTKFVGSCNWATSSGKNYTIPNETKIILVDSSDSNISSYVNCTKYDEKITYINSDRYTHHDVLFINPSGTLSVSTSALAGYAWALG